MTDNTDLLDRMAKALVITWPLDSAAEITEIMLTVLSGNDVEVLMEEVRAAVDRAIDRFDPADEAREARSKASYLDRGCIDSSVPPEVRALASKIDRKLQSTNTIPAKNHEISNL